MGTAATQAKSKYNHKTYDAITIRAPKGASEAITELAYLSGRSKADYIRTVISSHARSLERHDLAKAVGGGGINRPAQSTLEASEAVAHFLRWADRHCLAPSAELVARLEAMIEQL